MLNKIPGTKDFTIDESGNVRDYNGKIRKTYRNGDGYVTVSVLTDDGRWVTYGLHRLLAIVHVDGYTESRCFVNHRDSDVNNNDKSNLEWVTSSENNIHSEIMNNHSKYPSVVATVDGVARAMYNNAHSAANAYGISALQVWDSIKDKTSINGVTFSFKSMSSPVPVHLKQKCIKSRDKFGRIIQKGVKFLDIDTGEITEFLSLAEAARTHKANASHIFQCIPTGDIVRIFRKKYQVAFINECFQEITTEDLSTARNRGPKQVIAYNTERNVLVLYASATEFIVSNKLSKKAVTTALVNNSFRNINTWVAAYVTDENVVRIKNFIAVPATI